MERDFLHKHHLFQMQQNVTMRVESSGEPRGLDSKTHLIKAQLSLALEQPKNVLPAVLFTSLVQPSCRAYASIASPLSTFTSNAWHTSKGPSSYFSFFPACVSVVNLAAAV